MSEEPQIIRMDNLIKRYQACVYKIWALFPSDPLPEGDAAHFLIERLESILDQNLLTPRVTYIAPTFICPNCQTETQILVSKSVAVDTILPENTEEKE